MNVSNLKTMRHDDPDDDKVWFRSVRIFHTDDGWYVGTREGDIGPFPDKQLAVIALKRYIRELKDSDNRLTTSSG